MSTRSQIKISYLHREVLLYHHWDGYPKGGGAELIRLQKKSILGTGISSSIIL